MNDRFAFRCPSCNVKLGVSLAFLGRSCDCPRCGNQLTVELPAPDDELPVLVSDDGHRRSSQFAGYR